MGHVVADRPLRMRPALERTAPILPVLTELRRPMDSALGMPEWRRNVRAARRSEREIRRNNEAKLDPLAKQPPDRNLIFEHDPVVGEDLRVVPERPKLLYEVVRGDGQDTGVGPLSFVTNFWCSWMWMGESGVSL
jgi:hypothetical protein